MDASAEKLRILVLWPKWLWDEKQSPARRHYVRAVAMRPDVLLRLSGPGFPDWNDFESGIGNIERILPDCDVVWAYKFGGTEKSAPIKYPSDVSSRCLTVESFNECWAGMERGVGGRMHPGSERTVARECIKSRLRLAICHHANDVPFLQDAVDSGVQVVHIPHAADPRFFFSTPWEDRHGVLFTGVHDSVHYPLRTRWMRLIKSGKIEATIWPRPSNRCESPVASDQHVWEYARALSSHRVVLGCSSRWKYALNRYPEVAMSGCVHLADMPDCAPDGYRDMVCEVSMEMSDKELVDAVDAALNFTGLMSSVAENTASRSFTTDRYAERFVAVCRDAILG